MFMTIDVKLVKVKVVVLYLSARNANNTKKPNTSLLREVLFDHSQVSVVKRLVVLLLAAMLATRAIS